MLQTLFDSCARPYRKTKHVFVVFVSLQHTATQTTTIITHQSNCVHLYTGQRIINIKLTMLNKLAAPFEYIRYSQVKTNRTVVAQSRLKYLPISGYSNLVHNLL